MPFSKVVSASQKTNSLEPDRSRRRNRMDLSSETSRETISILDKGTPCDVRYLLKSSMGTEVPAKSVPSEPANSRVRTSRYDDCAEISVMRENRRSRAT